MSKRNLAVLSVLFGIFLVHCSKRNPFQGFYQSNWGPVEMVQDKQKVFGRYQRGSLTCDVRGQELDCQWEQEQAKGKVKLKKTPQGWLQGTWGHNNSVTDGGTWTLVRTNQPKE
jgi:hypothetical protein